MAHDHSISGAVRLAGAAEALRAIVARFPVCVWFRFSLVLGFWRDACVCCVCIHDLGADTHIHTTSLLLFHTKLT